MPEQKHAHRPHGPMGGPGGPGGGEKPRNFQAALGKILSHCLKPFALAVAVAIALAMAGSVLTIIGPDKLREMTNIITQGLMSGIDLDAVRKIGLSLILLYGLSALFSYVQSFIMATVTQKTAKTLRTDITKKINRLPFRYFDKTTYGDVLSRVTNDVDTLSQTLSQSVVSLFSAVTLLIGSLVMMFVTNLPMTLTAILSSCIGFFLMMVIVGKSQKYFRRMQSTLGDLNGHIEEMYTGHNVVKAYNGEDAARDVFTRLNGTLRDSAWKSQFLSGLMQPLMSFIGNFGYVAVCVVGGALALSGHIDFGVIVAFILYVRLFSQPLSSIAQAATSMQSAAAAAERVFDFLGAEEMPDESGKKCLDRARGDVEFDHVRFGYTPDKIIIHDFSAHARPGQKIAIVGPTGAGKTTLVNLLMRFYELNSGEIRLDGIPLSQLTRENIHDQFCMVLQDTWLFEGTIGENVRYAKKGVTDEQIVAACKAANIDHFIRTLPDGYDTVLSDRASLSAGQKQLLTIARAIVENAPLLILDEATSSVDTRTEALIQQAMDRLTQGRTSFVIAHRLSTIKNADLILVLKDGDIIESGTHEKLLKKGGFYAELYQSQFESAA